jgi:broad specificity phosphatase PhoE
MIKTFPIALLILLAACASIPAVPPAAADGVPPTTVIIVRHAEQQQEAGSDPPLAPEGVTRAGDLARLASDARISAIYVTQYLRTRATAEPTAQALEIPITEFRVEGPDISAYAAALARQVVADNRGQAVLIISHSNTVPAIVEAFTGIATDPIDHDEFDRLHVVIVPAATPVQHIQARYGPPGQAANSMHP